MSHDNILPGARFELEHHFDEDKKDKIHWLDVALGIIIGIFGTMMVLFAF